MEAKYFAIFALVFVVASVFISGSECTPVASEDGQAMDSMTAPSDDMMAPMMDKGQRRGRFYGGWPYGGYGGYGGMGGYGGGSAASAAAAASASSSGGGYGGYPYGK